jgi:hypothetical protein
MLPKRIPKTPKRESRWRSPAHRAWVRSHACSACGSIQNIECAHVRLGTDGGMGFKPSDEWCISLCSACHSLSHSVGEATFARDSKINLKSLAEEFIKQSPHRHKLREHKNGRPRPDRKTNWEMDDN